MVPRQGLRSDRENVVARGIRDGWQVAPARQVSPPPRRGHKKIGGSSGPQVGAFPLRRFWKKPRRLNAVAAVQAASREVLRLFRVLYAFGLQGYRVSRIRLILGVSIGKSGLYRAPSAATFASVSSSLELSASSETRCFSSLAFRLEIPSLGFLSLFAISAASVNVVVSQRHDSSALDVSHAFDGFSARHLVGLFHPTTASRISLQGLAPRAQPKTSFDAPCPHVVAVDFLPTVTHRRQSSTPRLQGLTPCAKS